MVQKLKNGKGAVARFGKGSVRVKAYTLKTRFGGQVELTTCKKTQIGEKALESIPHSNKIVLDFSSIESLDVMIETLQDLREDLANAAEV